MATATVTIGEPRESPAGYIYASIKAECSECDHVAYTGGDPERDWSGLIDHHLAQHEPGRALDIEVEWEVRANCSVCPDGGSVSVDEEGDLACGACDAYWDIHGRNGRTES